MLGPGRQRREEHGSEPRWRMPAEWSPHARCWMAWPAKRTPDAVRREAQEEAYARLARTIARFEPVAMVADPACADAAERHLAGSGIPVLRLPLDDAWIRDSGPTFLTDPRGGLAAALWRFNAWGGKYTPYADDAALGKRLARELGIRAFAAELTTEGGALHVDGDGTLLTTETAILNPNRNPGLSKAEAEAVLQQRLGVARVIWLPGSAVEIETDGHVDLIASFVRPGIALAEVARDPQHPQYRELFENRRALELTRDAQGRRLEVVTLERPTRVRSTSTRFCDSYVNFYLANGAVVMPAFGDGAADAAARAVAARAFPDRTVVQLEIDAICEGGGGIHCVTQQQPASDH